MAVVSSVLIEDSAQRDGRRWIAEQHTDQSGLVYVFRYLGAAATVAAAVMAARVAAINTQLTASEIATNIAAVLRDGSLAVTTLNYSTAAENFAALRAAYAGMTRTDAIFAGDFLSSLTNGQLQNAFGLTAGQVTTLRSNKLTPAATAAATIRASAGQ